jgi:hypothetical protein
MEPRQAYFLQKQGVFSHILPGKWRILAAF